MSDPARHPDDLLEERLLARFRGVVDDDLIRGAVRGELEHLRAEARVQDFVPLIAERRASERLARLAEATPPRTNDPNEQEPGS